MRGREKKKSAKHTHALLFTPNNDTVKAEEKELGQIGHARQAWGLRDRDNGAHVVMPYSCKPLGAQLLLQIRARPYS